MANQGMVIDYSEVNRIQNMSGQSGLKIRFS